MLSSFLSLSFFFSLPRFLQHNILKRLDLLPVIADRPAFLTSYGPGFRSVPRYSLLFFFHSFRSLYPFPHLLNCRDAAHIEGITKPLEKKEDGERKKERERPDEGMKGGRTNNKTKGDFDEKSQSAWRKCVGVQPSDVSCERARVSHIASAELFRVLAYTSPRVSPRGREVFSTGVRSHCQANLSASRSINS